VGGGKEGENQISRRREKKTPYPKRLFTCQRFSAEGKKEKKKKKKEKSLLNWRRRKDPRGGKRRLKVRDFDSPSHGDYRKRKRKGGGGGAQSKVALQHPAKAKKGLPRKPVYCCFLPISQEKKKKKKAFKGAARLD